MNYIRSIFGYTSSQKDIVSERCKRCNVNKASKYRKNGRVPNGMCSKCNQKLDRISVLVEVPTRIQPPRAVKQKKKAIPLAIKRMVWNKWIGETKGKAKCWCCRENDIVMISFHAGHVVPESKGGETTVENLRPICSNCNLSMGTTDMMDFIKKHNLH